MAERKSAKNAKVADEKVPQAEDSVQEPSLPLVPDAPTPDDPAESDGGRVKRKHFAPEPMEVQALREAQHEAQNAETAAASANQSASAPEVDVAVVQRARDDAATAAAKAAEQASIAEIRAAGSKEVGEPDSIQDQKAATAADARQFADAARAAANDAESVLARVKADREQAVKEKLKGFAAEAKKRLDAVTPKGFVLVRRNRYRIGLAPKNDIFAVKVDSLEKLVAEGYVKTLDYNLVTAQDIYKVSENEIFRLD